MHETQPSLFSTSVSSPQSQWKTVVPVFALSRIPYAAVAWTLSKYVDGAPHFWTVLAVSFVACLLFSVIENAQRDHRVARVSSSRCRFPVAASALAICLSMNAPPSSAGENAGSGSPGPAAAHTGPLPISSVSPHLEALLRYEEFVDKFKDVYLRATRRVDDRRLDLEKEKQDLIQRRLDDAKERSGDLAASADACYAIDKIETRYNSRTNKLDAVWRAEDAVTKTVNGVADLAGGYETLLLLIQQMHASKERTLALEYAALQRDGIVGRLERDLNPIRDHWRKYFESDEARSDDRELYEDATKAMADLLEALTH